MINFRTMRYLLMSILVMACFTITYGQDLTRKEHKKTYFSLFLSKGFRYIDVVNNDSNESSNFGMEAQLAMTMGNDFGLIIKSGWLKWPENRETVIPLLLGPSYQVIKSESVRVTTYGMIGPMLTIGNDYAGIFAKHEVGIQFTSSATKNLIVGISWGQDVVFHPSEYSVWKGSAGWSF